MTFNIKDDDGFQALEQNQQIDRWQYSVQSGCDVSPGTNDMTVQCTSGNVYFNGSTVSVSAQDNVSLTAADSTNPRKDTVYIDSNGTLTVETGTAESAEPSDETHADTIKPSPPDLANTNAVVLAEVWVASGATDISSADVRDRRLMADLAANITTSGFPSVSDDGTEVVASSEDFNFGTNLSASDDGDSTTTMSATDTHTDVSDGGTTTVSDTKDINFGTSLSTTDDGDQSVTVDVTEDAQTARLSATANQSIPNESWTKVEFDTVDWDSNSLASTSNNQFAIDQAGKYYVYAVWNYDQVINDSTRIIAMTEINGTRTKEIADGDIVGGSDFVRVAPGGLVDVNSGDTVGILTWHDHGSSLDIMSDSIFFGLARISGIGGGGGGGGNVITSHTHTVPFSELSNGSEITSPVMIPAGDKLTVKAWGAIDSDGNAPSGLTVALVNPSGSDVATANTKWSTDSTGIASYSNTSSSIEMAELEIRNDTGSGYTDPDGVAGRFGYEVS